MTSASQLARRVLTGLALAASVGLASGCRSASTAGEPTAPSGPASPGTAPVLDLGKVDWKNATIPGAFCQVQGTVTLHHGTAVVDSSGFGPLDIVAGTVAYGTLSGTGEHVAALQVWCDNKGGTADGQLAEGFLVFSGNNGQLRQIGALTAQYKQAGGGHIPFLTSVGFDASTVTTKQVWYAPSDATCCPSGRATTTWTWTGSTFKPARTTVTAR